MERFSYTLAYVHMNLNILQPLMFCATCKRAVELAGIRGE